MKTYRVIKQLLHDRIYLVGETIDLDTETAEDFLDQGLIEELEGGEAGKEADLKNMAPVPGEKSDTSTFDLEKIIQGLEKDKKILLDEIDLMNEMALEDNTTIGKLKAEIEQKDGEITSRDNIITGMEQDLTRLSGASIIGEGEKLKIELDKDAGADNEIKKDESAGEENDLTGKKD